MDIIETASSESTSSKYSGKDSMIRKSAAQSVDETTTKRTKSKCNPSLMRPCLDFDLVKQGVNPLALPKGQHIVCDMCGFPAFFTCRLCKNAYYCSEQHMRQDLELMHPYVCSMLLLLKGPIKFSHFKSERTGLKKQRRVHTKRVVDISFERAKRSLRLGKPREALMQGAYSIRFAKALYKQDDVRLIPFFLMFAEAYAADNKLGTALQYMSKTEYIMLVNARCPNTIKADLYKTNGVINIYADKLEEAIESFSDEIFYSTEAYHTEHKRTARGYFNLGTAFLKLSEKQTAFSLFMHSLEIMQTTLYEEFEYIVSIEGQATILKTTDPDSKRGNLTDEELSEHKTELYFIHNQVRKNMSNIVRDTDAIKVCFVLALLHYATGEFKEGIDFVHKANTMRPRRMMHYLEKRLSKASESAKKSVAILSATTPTPPPQTSPTIDLFEKLKAVKKHLQRQLSRKAKEIS